MGLYAAYGSNMDPAQMLRRCPSSPHTGTGWIQGWRLTFGAEEYGWEGALATLVPDDDPGGPGVFVALYDLTDADEQTLDAWEGADSGLYRRVHLRVHTLTGDDVAYVYVLDAFEGGLPSAIPPRWRADRLRGRPALPGVPNRLLVERSSPAIMAPRPPLRSIRGSPRHDRRDLMAPNRADHALPQPEHVDGGEMQERPSALGQPVVPIPVRCQLLSRHV